jgi:hypothetical protein
MWHSSCRSRSLSEHLKEENRPGNRRVEAGHAPGHGDADKQVDTTSDRWREPLPLRADHEADRPAKIRLAIGLDCLGFGPDNPYAAQTEGRELFRKVVDPGHEEMLDGARTRLDCRRGERRSPRTSNEDPVDTDGLGAADHAAEVLGVFNAIEGQKEGRLVPSDATGKEIFGGRLRASLHDKCDPLMPVEPGELADERPLNFDDRNAHRGCMQNELLQRTATLWHHE